MSWLRLRLRTFLVILLGTIGGVFGNLLAAIIESSFGRFTLLQAILMVVGIIVVVILTTSMEHWPARDNTKLYQELKQHRRELYRLKKLNEAGFPWTPSDAIAWVNHQLAIKDFRDELESREADVDSDPIDEASPPRRLPPQVRMTRLLKQNASLIMVPLLFGLSLLLSPVAQHGYLKYVAAPTPTPTPTGTPTMISPTAQTPAGTPTTISPTAQTPAGTPTTISPTAQTLEPTRSSSLSPPTPILVPPTATQVRPTATMILPTPSPRPTGYSVPWLIAPVNGQVFDETTQAIELSWQAVGALAADEFYDVYLTWWTGGPPWRGEKHWYTKETSCVVGHEYFGLNFFAWTEKSGRFEWNVVVRRGQSPDAVQLSPISEQRFFLWQSRPVPPPTWTPTSPPTWTPRPITPTPSRTP